MADATLSIIIPCFNEGQTIGPVIEEVIAKTEAVGSHIIVVDDGSDDGTAEAARAAGNERVQVISHPVRAGKSAAVRTGALAARTVWIGTMDGDGQDDPNDLLRMAAEIDLACVGDVGLVGGVRQNRTDGANRKWASRLANGLRKALLHDDCPDTACGLKVLPRDLYLAMPFFDALHRYLPAWNKHFGYEARYVPVTNRPRAAGQSKYSNIGRAVAGFFDLMGVVWLMRRTHTPGKHMLLRPEGTR
ncbi:glycosyltransferase family 2 protein [Parvularcula lutaonensis]|uniref:Glycosyltransferase family 2 protein n=1 Tax=Parvularcula lutaonensis TaxID=491923 RepID=A0ABV7MD77_9PROT|nr:glycosyltransferase family 2 protein [Parvularcula lutaonensis]